MDFLICTWHQLGLDQSTKADNSESWTNNHLLLYVGIVREDRLLWDVRNFGQNWDTKKWTHWDCYDVMGCGRSQAWSLNVDPSRHFAVSQPSIMLIDKHLCNPRWPRHLVDASSDLFKEWAGLAPWPFPISIRHWQCLQKPLVSSVELSYWQGQHVVCDQERSSWLGNLFWMCWLTNWGFCMQHLGGWWERDGEPIRRCQ